MNVSCNGREHERRQRKLLSVGPRGKRSRLLLRRGVGPCSPTSPLAWIREGLDRDEPQTNLSCFTLSADLIGLSHLATDRASEVGSATDLQIIKIVGRTARVNGEVNTA